MSTKVVNVAVIGAGVVGSSLLDQLLAMKSTITYNLVLLAEAERSLISKDFSPLNVGSDWKSALAAASWQDFAIGRFDYSLKDFS